MTKYYCQQKFNWAQVSMFDGKVQSCCKATEDSTSLDQISKQHVGFFNYDQIQQDRRDMLDGKKISGCSSCWNLEDQGLPSRRTKTGSDFVSIANVDNCIPETLNIVLDNLCAMTCIYCCKKFSQSWRRDLIKNGDYDSLVTDDPRHRVSIKDKLLIKLSHTELQRSSFYNKILSQIQECSNQIKTVMITGGEPLLSSNLQQILDIFSNQPIEVIIYTGLGIKPSYLVSQLAKLRNQKIKFVISAENIGQLHEFSRYGSSFDEFCNNLEILKQSNFQIEYACSVSNTTIFGLLDFLQWSNSVDPNTTYSVDTVADPDYLAPNVIDDNSKGLILPQIQKYKNLAYLVPIIEKKCSDLQRRNAHAFITEFSKRRNLSLHIFPNNFLSWLGK